RGAQRARPTAHRGAARRVAFVGSQARRTGNTDAPAALERLRSSRSARFDAACCAPAVFGSGPVDGCWPRYPRVSTYTLRILRSGVAPDSRRHVAFARYALKSAPVTTKSHGVSRSFI